VRSCIGRSDDLVAGKSYYLVEVESVLSLVKASERTEPHLFIFDELFRGTNAVERIAAAEAVLDSLVSSDRPHVAIAATHDGELVDLLAKKYAVYHLGDAVGPDGLVFDYRLTAGPATSRNAITLLRLNGAPPFLVDKALARAAALDHGRLTTHRD
jgi:DNA mismatch repair ATPase MutS